MDCWTSETEGKRIHDPLFYRRASAGAPTMKPPLISTGEKINRCVWVPGPVIVGAGPSGLSVAACLKEKGIPCLILERSNCIASLWQLRTYDRLRLHLPKQFCELPLMPFPSCFPTYPTKQQFIVYLESYVKQFDIRPVFGRSVESAEFDEGVGFWRIRAVKDGGEKTEFLSRWLIVATGENADAVVPEIEGVDEFRGPVMHTSVYRSGEGYRGKRVLVVGCGNSGMELCLDLCNHNAQPSLVVREAVHVLPREMLGCSTFGISMWLLKWLPARTVDRLLLLVTRLMLGDTALLGLIRPQLGPLELKAISGKTPVLDVGTLDRIKSGHIKVCPAIKRLVGHGAQFVDGTLREFDAIILATGYKSNVPSWLKESEFFSEKDGLPRQPFPNGWKGERGLYAVGFTKRGILGASMDAWRIAHDIEQCWLSDAKQISTVSFSCSSIVSKNGKVFS